MSKALLLMHVAAQAVTSCSQVGTNHQAQLLQVHYLKLILKKNLFKTLSPFEQGLEGYFGDSDLTKLRYGNQENDKYIDGIRDLTVSGKRDWPKIGHGMRDLCLRVCRDRRKPSRPTGSSNQSK